MSHDKYHTFWNRFLAIFIDGMILKPLEWMDAHVLSGAIDSLGIMAWGLFYSVIGIVYYVAMHVRYGQTIGKTIAKVKVLDVSEEGYLSIKQACLRDILPILLVPISIYIYIQFAFYNQTWEGLGESSWFLYFGFAMFGWVLLEMISMLFNDKRRAIHDFIAGSVVVKTNLTSQGSRTASPPAA